MELLSQEEQGQLAEEKMEDRNTAQMYLLFLVNVHALR